MSIVLGLILSAALPTGPRAIQGSQQPLLYCYSGSETPDDVTRFFCRALEGERGKQKGFDVVVTEPEPSHARIELLGVDSFSTFGGTTVLTKEDWTPEHQQIRVEAVLTVGDIVKTFVGEGDLYEATAEVVEAIGKWVQKNPNALGKPNRN